jgi:glycosyltransferase involved in cell wall biosynthesis
MKITFILPTVSMSGGVKVVAIYAKRLKARGHSVVIVSPPPQVLGLKSRIKSIVKGNGWPRAAHAPASHLDRSGLDHRVLECWRPVTEKDVPDADVVITTWWETAEWVAALPARKGAKVYFVQGHEIFPYLPVARCHATYRLPLRKIVVARWLQDVMLSEYDDANVEVVPNSVDHAQFFSPERGKQPAPTVGLLYSSASIKGVDVALSALRMVRKRVPGLRVLIFGSERPGAAIPLPNDAEFFFSPPQNEIRDLYARCDAWLTASRSEGFNLAALEAMACRTPVVSTRTGWPEEAVANGKNGILVDIDDAAGLARGVEWLVSLPDEEWRKVSREAHRTAGTGSWEQSTRKFERALFHACGQSAQAEMAREDAA